MAADEAALDGENLDLCSIRRACEELFFAAVDHVGSLLTTELPSRSVADATDRRDARTVAQHPLSTGLDFQAVRRRRSHAYIAVVRPDVPVDRAQSGMLQRCSWSSSRRSSLVAASWPCVKILANIPIGLSESMAVPRNPSIPNFSRTAMAVAAVAAKPNKSWIGLRRC